MSSPIIQACIQGNFLKDYLNRHAEVLLGKILGRQSRFRGMPIDTLVAISDSGIINRPKTMSLDEVCKADQICDRVRSLHGKRQKDNSVFNLNLNSTVYSFNKDEVNRVVAFLLKEHKPLPSKTEAEAISKPNLQTSPPEKRIVIQVKAESLSKPKPVISKPNNAIAQLASKYSCRQCNKTNLSVASGKYGYYFKCLDCDGNTPINVSCQTCNSKKKIRKSGELFYVECATCTTSGLFYTNPAI